VRDYQTSGLSIHQWCRNNAVVVEQLRYWLGKFGSERETTVATATSTQAWASLKMMDDALCDTSQSDANQPPEPGVAVHVGAARIDVRSGFDAKLLGDVLRVVIASC
jgi:hypothetical protein